MALTPRGEEVPRRQKTVTGMAHVYMPGPLSRAFPALPRLYVCVKVREVTLALARGWGSEGRWESRRVKLTQNVGLYVAAAAAISQVGK